MHKVVNFICSWVNEWVLGLALPYWLYTSVFNEHHEMQESVFFFILLESTKGSSMLSISLIHETPPKQLEESSEEQNEKPLIIYWYLNVSSVYSERQTLFIPSLIVKWDRFTILWVTVILFCAWCLSVTYLVLVFIRFCFPKCIYSKTVHLK